jgi:hypothetical protein
MAWSMNFSAEERRSGEHEEELFLRFSPLLRVSAMK